MSGVTNALSIDLEDWFCVYNLSHVIRHEDWDRCELRVVESTRRILDLFGRHDARATFFVLGWIADRVPHLIREVAERGHEIATHGYSHTLITKMTESEFEADLVESLKALKRCGIEAEVIGFRAPSFTIVRRTWWALRILEKHGLRYDSSVFPIGFHPDYGIGDAPMDPYPVTERLREFPMSCVEVMGRRLPCSGGGYFRLMPYAYTRWAIQSLNRRGRPAVFYLHPWEVDPGQPHVALPLTKRIRHYYGLSQTEKKLGRLLTDFRFRALRDVLAV